MSLNHKGLSSPVSLLTQVPKLAAYGLQYNKACRKIFLAFHLNTRATPLQQGRISVNGPSFNHLHAHSASRLNLFSTWSPAANRILMKADTLGATTQSFSILLKPFPLFQTVYYMPISLRFYPRASSLVILSDQTLS